MPVDVNFLWMLISYGYKFSVDVSPKRKSFAHSNLRSFSSHPRAFQTVALKLWNQLPIEMSSCKDIVKFKITIPMCTYATVRPFSIKLHVLSLQNEYSCHDNLAHPGINTLLKNTNFLAF